ncbi:MAG: helix-turn-helix transcriptional regulator [Deltaproteobacteria bacterium]|nr:helix-turn-helix transcriptional regulator [Deltaproteobacteria bacterium]
MTKLPKSNYPSQFDTFTSSSIFRKVFACKWTFEILMLINLKPHNYNAIFRNIHGISKKVLSDRLKKLLSLGLIQRSVFSEVPVKVVYSLTKSGKRLVNLIKSILALEREISN